jgi:hypothetical protein
MKFERYNKGYISNEMQLHHKNILAGGYCFFYR